MNTKNIQAKFQKLAKALLIPISLISAGSLSLALGSLLTSPVIISKLPILKFYPIILLANILSNVGLAVLHNLHVIYAIALAFSFSKEKKEYGAFAGFLGYYAFIRGMGFAASNFAIIAELLPENAMTTVLGIETVNCNIIGGILAGVLCAVIHNKTKDIELPTAFAFFKGVRFTPIACMFSMFTAGLIFPFIWVWISRGINALAQIMASSGIFGPFIFAFVERLLIPTGLHQIWLTVIRRTAVSGEYIFGSGAIATGVEQAFPLYLSEGLPVSPTGITLQEMVKFGSGPQIAIMLGALPGIALALYHCAYKEKRKEVKSLFIAAAVTAIVAGVSEPVEFIFLFAAPLLYLIYAILNGVCWVICYIFGNGISGDSNIIGFLINGVLRENSNWWVVAVLAIIMFILCYFLFKWWIIKFDVKTPGRGGDYDEQMAFAAEIAGSSISFKTKEGDLDINNPEVLKAQIIIKGLGGKGNIKEIESCFTRLRVVLIDRTKFDEKIISTTGCNGIIKPNNQEIQIVYGPSVTLILKTINKELEKAGEIN